MSDEARAMTTDPTACPRCGSTVGIAAEELVALREAGDALAEMVRDVQPYLPSIPVARLDAALDRWEQTQ